MFRRNAGVMRGLGRARTPTRNEWARLDSNQGPTGYEPAALPLSYGPVYEQRPATARRWSGRRGSNSRHPPWKGGALPTELLPRASNIVPTSAPGAKWRATAAGLVRRWRGVASCIQGRASARPVAGGAPRPRPGRLQPALPGGGPNSRSRDNEKIPTARGGDADGIGLGPLVGERVRRSIGRRAASAQRAPARRWRPRWGDGSRTWSPGRERSSPRSVPGALLPAGGRPRGPSRRRGPRG